MTELQLKKVLFLRLDKIGDLVSTLPVDQHPSLQKLEVRWAIGQGLKNLVNLSEPAREFQEWPKKFSWITVKDFWKFIKAYQPDLSVSFHAPWWVNLLLLLAGVNKRVGPASQWHHFLFLNRRLKQNRSESIKHEADYNFELLRFALGEDLKQKLATPILKISPASNIQLPEILKDKNYVVIHAGMAGSSLNWSQKNYIALAEELCKKNLFIVLTGTALDLPYLSEIRPALSKNENVIDLVEKLNFITLQTVLQKAQAVVAPSTGIAHLSASLGQKTIALFSPLPVQSTTRWAPRGVRATAINPQVKCPSHFKCLKQKCEFYPCMQKITVAEVLNATLSNSATTP